MTSIPKTFPARAGDIAVYLLRAGSDNQAHATFYMDGRLDETRIRKALRLVLDAEPVLGCRLEERWWRPRWERIEDLDETSFFQVIETSDPRSEIDRFLLSETDAAVGPQVAACLVRGKETDTLLLRTNHEPRDGGAMREFFALLTSTYRRLKMEPDYRPEPNVAGSRSMRQVSRRLSFVDKLKVIRRAFRDARSRNKPPGNWSFPPVKATPEGKRMYVRKTGHELFPALRAYAKAHGWSLNDVLTAACLRAFRIVLNPAPGTPLRLRMTANLRRWLPDGKGEAMCNLSGGYVLNMGTELGNAFEDTAAKVSERMASLKDDYIGLGVWVTLPLLKWIPFAWIKKLLLRAMVNMSRRPSMPPQISNLGVLDSGLLDFGDVKVTDVELAGPVIHPPNLQFNLYTLNGELRMNVSTYESGFDETTIEDLFDKVIAELPV